MSATHVACYCNHYEWVVYNSVPNLFNYKIVITYNATIWSWGRLSRLFKLCTLETQHKMKFSFLYQASCFYQA